ncbi:hypothetical protein [Mucilaginibacter sp. SP1R1]|uniref:hypothetical protein n=1 Tax=Mucilaginibacter sp. SP1R1 TaxID=2723091 RepID=UPI00161C9936|nr:hypothetical protein [Mucilaginibacter sp. SP1R1]MBB6150712.1 putative nuclease with TOPRIM domain [Mucilaginibacter sp. SP1R1]
MPNTDNPKLAARYFLNAIDKVDGMAEKYAKEIKETDEQLPQLQSLMNKPFEKDTELQQMKSELSKLEREIAQKIQEKQEQEKQPLSAADEVINGPESKVTEAIVVPMKSTENLMKVRNDQAVNAAPVELNDDTERLQFKRNRGLKL